MDEDREHRPPGTAPAGADDPATNVPPGDAEQPSGDWSQPDTFAPPGGGGYGPDSGAPSGPGRPGTGQ